MVIVVYIIFFFSGASALIFEALWFHLTGLLFGNSVWATSIVLSSFMGGMALGNGLVAFRGHKIRTPIYFYALLEIIIAISGGGLVFILPKLTEILVPVYRLSGQNDFILNFLRAILAFIFMVVPTSAMGATLPVVVKALYAKNPSFGRVLGRLYGWNTLGATVGVIAAELWLIKWFGIKGAGVFAVCLNLSAAFTALWYYTATRKASVVLLQPEKPENIAITSWTTRRLLCASFLSGLTLLALEVLWFRFILLFVSATGWNFAIMLAMVLAGISLGGLFASKCFGWRSDAHHFLLPAAIFNGILIVVLYANLSFGYGVFERYRTDIRIVFIAFFLIFPVSFISGMIFTMLGKALHTEMHSETRATGLLTLTNTIGGMCGALIASLLLIPSLGIEQSFFGLAVNYGIIAILVCQKDRVMPVKRQTMGYYLVMGAYVIVLLFFPFGFMNFHYLAIPVARYRSSGEQRVAMKEGITETIQYLRRDLFTIPYYYRLLTNNHSMSGTLLNSRRYMKFFVYFPVAIHTDLKNALLIGFGTGTTAKALTDTRSLEQLDIVDISKDIIEASQVVFPTPKENPIYDPRVRIHIEDGRFFLLTTEQTFDLITAEPPPPKHSGVVNLYTQEYFQLIYDRLSEGGIITYWLPVYQLSVPESQAIIKGFCNVFETCSLWTGADLEWIMVGVKHPADPVTDQEFARQWHDPVVGPEMQALGFENPEQFGAFFIADGERLNAWVGNSLPLTDNYPQRLSFHAWNRRIYINTYLDFMDETLSQVNFMESGTLRKMWPESLRQETAEYFPLRHIINGILAPPKWKRYSTVFYLHQCLHNPVLKNYLLWILESDQYAQNILAYALKEMPEQVSKEPEAYLHLAAAALQEGKLLQAEHYLDLLTDLKPWQNWDDSLALEFYQMRMYLLYISEYAEQARQIGQEYVSHSDANKARRTQEIEEYWNWLVHISDQNPRGHLSDK